MLFYFWVGGEEKRGRGGGGGNRGIGEGEAPTTRCGLKGEENK